jgi:hypothetical protein
MRAILWLLALALVAFGALSAHYELDADGHHRMWAEKSGMPPPSFAIFVMGIALAVLGGTGIGWLLARRRS